MVLTSESAIGKKIPQSSGGPCAASLQPDQFRDAGTRMAQRIPKNMHCSEVPVGTQGFVEIIRHIFACQIGYYFNARERQAEGTGSFGHAGGFHFDRDSALRIESLLLDGSGSDTVNRADGSGRGAEPTGDGRSGKPSRAGGDTTGDDQVRQAQRRIEGATEAGADDMVCRE